MPNYSLSANTLFHFTDTLDSIENILTNEFYPHFCLEDNSVFYPKESHLCKYLQAIPMVCFCDIPLSQIRNHMKYYGTYCIGLKKEWGINKKINPILYYHKESDYCQSMKAMYSRVYKEAITWKKLDEKRIEWDKFGKTFYHFFTYNFASLGDYLIKLGFQSKLYEGKLHKKNRVINNVKFYDEKEWRFTPSLQTLVKNKIPISLTEEEFKDEAKKIEYTSILSKCCKLSFNPNDIKYIIVKNDNEILNMMDKIDTIKAKYSYKEKNLLKSRLISMKQVLEDF
jgi:hypothetical protein